MGASYALPIEDNPDHRCLVCGKRLKEAYRLPEETRPRWDGNLSVEANKQIEAQWEAANRTPTGEYGQYGSNAFCSFRCSHAFALAAAKAGYRMVARG